MPAKSSLLALVPRWLRGLEAPVALVAGCSAVACAPIPSPIPAPTAYDLRCFDTVSGVRWLLSEDAGRPTLDRWCSSVGPPVLTVRSPQQGQVARLLVVTWNIHVGGGIVKDFLAKHWTDRERTGLVLLLQEAYRSGDAVPGSYPKDLNVPSAIRPKPRSPEIGELANDLGLSVAYVPSMRNGRDTAGDHREDRGNAILSSEPLSDVIALELPFGKQRRVALAGTVRPRSLGIGPVRVVATHFDVGAGRFAQAQALRHRLDDLLDLPMIIGGDFNSREGLNDDTVRTIGSRIPIEACETGRTIRWPLRLDKLAFFIGRFDFIFSTLGTDISRKCRTIQEAFRSDHLPVVLTISFAPGMTTTKPMT